MRLPGLQRLNQALGGVVEAGKAAADAIERQQQSQPPTPAQSNAATATAAGASSNQGQGQANRHQLPFAGRKASEEVPQNRGEAEKLYQRILKAFQGKIRTSDKERTNAINWLCNGQRTIRTLLTRLGGNFLLGLYTRQHGNTAFEPAAWGGISSLVGTVLDNLIDADDNLPEPTALLTAWEQQLPDFEQIVERHKRTATPHNQADSQQTSQQGPTSNANPNDPLNLAAREAIAEAILPGETRQVSPQLAQRLLEQFPSLPEAERLTSVGAAARELAIDCARKIAAYLRSDYGHTVVPETSPDFMPIAELAIRLVVENKTADECRAEVDEALRQNALDTAIGIINA